MYLERGKADYYSAQPFIDLKQHRLLLLKLIYNQCLSRVTSFPCAFCGNTRINSGAVRSMVVPFTIQFGVAIP